MSDLKFFHCSGSQNSRASFQSPLFWVLRDAGLGNKLVSVEMGQDGMG